MRRLILLPIVFIFFFTWNCGAQTFGGTPPSVKWYEINTIPAKIIYPAGMDSEASQVAFLVTRLSNTTLPTIGTRQKTIPILFHNLTTIPNGYVQLAPFRSEFQLTPSQNSFDLGSLPWNQTLAIHEYRHVQQYNNFRVGLSKTFYILFGQDGLAFANNLSVPNWFWEGDAVFQETLVSKQGRGRLPLFLYSYEAIWLARKNYSWMKLRNGSYRDYTPNHYPLGYMLVAYGREKYGPNFWDKTAGDAAAFKGLFYPLQKSIYRHAGITFKEFHVQALNYFRNQLPDIAFDTENAIFAQKEKHFAADQLFPQWQDSNHIIFLRSGYRLPPDFVRQNLTTGKVERLKFQSQTLDNSFSYRSRKIVYSSFEPDLRWGWRDFNIIRLLDINTGKDKRLTRKTRYFSPDLSPDGRTIVAVDFSTTEKSTLHILDARSGKLIRRLENLKNHVYTYPKFYDSNTIVSAVRNQKGEMCLMSIEISSGIETSLTEWSMDVIGFISVDEKSVYFTRTSGGQDQGFYIKDRQIYPLLDGGYTGNYQLSAGFEKIAWNSFTSAGYRLHTGNRKNLFSAKQINFEEEDTLNKHLISALDNPPFQIPSPIPDSAYPINRYKTTSRFFNFHSWRPVINDPDYTLSLMGENILNDFQSSVYIGYNTNEKYKKIGADFTYGGIFPFINLGTEYMTGRNAYYGSQKIYWNELLSYTGFTIPLNLSRGRWLTSLQTGSDLSFHQRYFSGIYKDSIRDKGYLSVGPQLFFSNQLLAGRQQINPSFAQTLQIQYNSAISNISGNQFLVSANFYLPGITATHSLLLSIAYQQHDSLNQIRFSNSFPFSRGYSGENFYKQYRVAFNYAFPLAYPDWGFGNILYFLRIRANTFFDFTGIPVYATNGPGVGKMYRSAGIELYFDTQWWNELPLSFGIRYSHLFDDDYEGRLPNQWELILPLNILSSGYSNHLRQH